MEIKLKIIDSEMINSKSSVLEQSVVIVCVCFVSSRPAIGQARWRSGFYWSKDGGVSFFWFFNSILGASV